MRIFIDSANILEIQKYLDWGVCDGVTTNPTICLKNGVKGGMNGVLKRTEEIAALICPRPVSVEVTSEVPNEIIEQAKQYKKLGENIVVKVTITDSKGNSFLPIIRELVEKEIQVNITAMMTFNQMVLATQCIASAKKRKGNIL
jgi:transaldolase